MAKPMVMKKKRSGWGPLNARDPQTRKLIARLQRDEDRALAGRRQRLAAGIKRALPHLRAEEMDTIELTIFTAIGRSVVGR